MADRPVDAQAQDGDAGLAPEFDMWDAWVERQEQLEAGRDDFRDEDGEGQ